MAAVGSRWPRWDTSQLVENVDYAGYAEVLGLRGITVDRPDQVADAWGAAFAADRPIVLDVHTDATVGLIAALLPAPQQPQQRARRQRGWNRRTQCRRRAGCCSATARAGDGALPR